MKNIFKFFGLALIAGAMFTACDGTVKYTISATANDATMGTVTGGGEYALGEQVTLTATPNDGYQFVSWNDNNTQNPRTITVTDDAEYVATFQDIPAINGVTAIFDGETLELGWNSLATNGQLFLVQAAKNAEGTSVYFPYLVAYLQGSSAADMAVADCELYKDTYYTADGSQYGDWQLYSNTSINITNFDATSYAMSGNFVNSMYSLTDVVEEVAENEDDATHKNLSVTFNGTFEMASKGFTKMIVK